MEPTTPREITPLTVEEAQQLKERRELLWLDVIERIQLVSGYGDPLLETAPHALLEQVLREDLLTLLNAAIDAGTEAARYRRVLGQVSDLLRTSVETGR